MSSRKNINFIENFLHKLGLNTLEIKLFLTLTENGPMTILQASRASGIERTKIYRMADEMVERGILEKVVADKKAVFKATGIHNLELLIQNREADTKFLKDTFLTFSENLNDMVHESSETKVLYYKGMDGIKQMLWNQLNAKDEVVCYTYRLIQEVVGMNFFYKWVNEFEDIRKLKIREIRTEEFYESLNKSKASKTKAIMQTNNIRYISSKILPITHEVDIYNNVFALFYWQGEEVFGVEIYNQQIANMQKNMFEVFWKMAKVDKKAMKLLKNSKSI